MTGRLVGRRVGIAVLAGGLVGLCVDRAALAVEPPAPPPDTTGVSSGEAPGSRPEAPTSPEPKDALSGYLGTLHTRTDDEFLLRELSISDAEVDSLIRVYEETGETPAGLVSARWDADVSLGGFRYNRVEGANVMGDARVTAPTPRLLQAFGRAGYGWASAEPTWHGGLRVGVPLLPGTAVLEITHARDVLAYGSGGVPGNSVLALMAGRDQDDYFLAEGPSISLDASPGPLRCGVTWRREDQESLRNETDFTLFDEGSRFRVNPPIRPGRSSRVELSVGAGSLADGRWATELIGTTAGRGLGGDFDFEKLTLELRTRWPLWLGDVLRIALEGGNVTGDAPYQSLYFLGGTRRLRGYDVNEFPTRRSGHLAVDYALGTNPLRWVPYVRRFRVQPVPFFDGAAILESQTPGGERIEPDSPVWRFDAGLALQYNVFGIPGRSGLLRLDIARRLDRDDDNMTYRLGFTLER